MARIKLTTLNNLPNDLHYFDPDRSVKIITLQECWLIKSNKRFLGFTLKKIHVQECPIQCMDLYYTNAKRWVINSNKGFLGFTYTKILLDFILKNTEIEYLGYITDVVGHFYKQAKNEYSPIGSEQPQFNTEIEQRYRALKILKEELEEYRI